MDEDIKLSNSQKQKIVNNLMIRVMNKDRRVKIQQLALSLSDFNTDSDEYYSALHYYSLSENWDKINKDHKEFYIPGYIGDDEGRPPKSESTGSKRGRTRRSPK